jgi:Protein of unknown function (DUF1552)
MSPARVTRRALLGAALGSATWLATPSAWSDAAPERPRSKGPPLRFVGVYTPHGRAHELWQPRSGFDLAYPGSVLKPLDDPNDAQSFGRTFRDRVVVVDGVDLTAGIAVGTSGHDGARVILTGSGADGKGSSLDQFLAVERGLGAETVHTSLVLGVGDAQTAIGQCISYGTGGTPLPKWIDPAQTFAELFALPLSGERREEMERQHRTGRSILDAERADLERLAAHLPAADRNKLEQHQAALRDIEKRLDGPSHACAAPVPVERTRFRRFGSYDGGGPSLDAITDLQIDMLARAMACDLTRFATLVLGDLSRTHLFPELPDDVHGDVAHRYDASDEHRPGSPPTWQALGIQNRYSYSKVARLLARLDEAGVLGDTIVLVSGDMGDPARHSSRGVPTLVAGGCGGHFAMGRYIDLRQKGSAEGVPNNRVLVSIAQAFGVESDRFGHCADPGVVTGRLAELQT